MVYHRFLAPAFAEHEADIDAALVNLRSQATSSLTDAVGYIWRLIAQRLNVSSYSLPTRIASVEADSLAGRSATRCTTVSDRPKHPSSSLSTEPVSRAARPASFVPGPCRRRRAEAVWLPRPICWAVPARSCHCATSRRRGRRGISTAEQRRCAGSGETSA